MMRDNPMNRWLDLGRVRALFAFGSDKAGNVAMMMAVVLPVLVGSVGLAIDVANTYEVKSQLVAAADAAVLGGVKAASIAAADGDKDWQKKAAAEAVSLFQANIAHDHLQSVEFTPSFTRKGARFDGVASFRYVSPTYFMQFFGQDNVVISQTAKASLRPKNYIDISFLIDTSSSMGIGATSADQTLMFASEAKCAFACHVPRSALEASQTPAAARAIGAKLRIDVVREALLLMIGDIDKLDLDGGQVRIGIYTFSNELSTLLAPETDLRKVKKSIETLALAQAANVAVGGTYVSAALTQLPTVLDKSAKGGDGLSPESPKSFVVLVSDGIEDSTSTKPTGKTVVPAGKLLANTVAKLFTNNLDETRDYKLLPTWVSNSLALNLRRGGATQQVNGMDGSILQPFVPSACNTLKKTRTVISARIKHVASQGGLRGGLTVTEFTELKYLDSVEKDLEKAFKTCATDPELAVTADKSEDIAPMFKAIIDDIIAPDVLALTE